MKKIIIKLSGEAIAGNQKNFDDGLIQDICKDIIKIANKGIGVGIVVGGGNFFRGRTTTECSKNFNQSKLDQIGMLATVMNGIYLSESFKMLGSKATVITPFKVSEFTKVYNVEDATQSINNGEIMIFAGGTGHPMFSTDTITALRSAELGVDCVFYAKNVNGIYDNDPKTHLNAKRFKSISYNKVLEYDLRAIDTSAICLLKDANLNARVYALSELGSGVTTNFENLGTLISNDIKEEFYL